MKNIADKFKAIGKVAKQTQNASSIFGSAGNLAQSIEANLTYRIGFYPIIDGKKPEIAMGIASCLCYLVEQYKNVEAYRVFAKIEDSDSEEIDINDSQFKVDDWEFDGLDDNVRVSGTVEQDDSNYTLNLIIDNSLLEESKDVKLTYQFTALHSLINDLPKIAEEIVRSIKDEDELELIISYSNLNASTELLNDIISAVFYWNLDLYLHLWDVEWEDEEIDTQFNDMLSFGEKLNHPFTVWCLSMMAKQVMQVGLDAVGDVIVPLINSVFDQDKEGTISVIVLSKGLVNLGYVDEAIALIEKFTSKNSTDTNALVWITLTETYMQGSQFHKAIDANQRAIELGIEDERLFWGYAQLLILAENNDWYVEQLLLVDPDEIDEADQIRQEIIMSLENILQFNPSHIAAIYTLLPYLIDIESEDIWKYFGQLVKLDKSSHFTRNIIDNLYELEDLKPGFYILNEQAKTDSENPAPYLNLAQLAIIDENTALAQEYLTACEKFIPQFGESIDIEVQRLKLSATYLNFDQEYSEIKMILDAKRAVPEHDVEFLEDAIEIAPKFGDLYVTLARCYLSWKDTDSALEVLKDAQNKIGSHPRVIQTLGQVLWDQGKKVLSFEQLNKGLKYYPNDISLLTQIAGYLIDNDQLVDSKPFIERVELIAPSHPRLWTLRKQIAEKTS